MSFHKHSLVQPGTSWAGELADFLAWQVWNEPCMRFWHHRLHPTPFPAQEHTTQIWLTSDHKKRPRYYKKLGFRQWLWGKLRPRRWKRGRDPIRERLEVFVVRAYTPKAGRNEQYSPQKRA